MADPQSQPAAVHHTPLWGGVVSLALADTLNDITFLLTGLLLLALAYSLWPQGETA